MTHVIAMGGGGFAAEVDRRMHEYLLSTLQKTSPRVCLIATGKGDRSETVQAFYGAFEKLDCRPTHLALFDRTVRNLREYVLAQDILLIWGGNTASLLAAWRAHGVDEVVREAAAAGIVIAGACAGAIACFESGVTDSFADLDPIHGGLGLLRGSVCPHYDADPKRPSAYARMILAGELESGFAIDAAAALRFEDGALVDAVASTPGARAYRVTVAQHQLVEDPIAARVL